MRATEPGRGARVLSVGRNTVWIVFDDEYVARPAALPKRLTRLSVVPGDCVLARPLEDGRTIIDAVEPRSFALVRRTAGGRTNTMAANIDTLAIVMALERPPPNPAMLDELLAFAESHELRAIVIFTKPDLVTEERRDEFVSLYAGLGYPTFAINPKAGIGVDAVAKVLATHHSLFIGQSGVGKSSLFRALGGEAAVGDVSRLGRGKQTTTTARLYRFPEGFLIDSPGVGDFALHPAERETEADWCNEVAFGFVEFRALVPLCRFSDCTHRNEPNCAVRRALDAGQIARSRYQSYLFIAARETVS